MKLLVFAHKPPPHHGQSYMVELLLGALGGDRRGGGESPAGQIECIHVDCRFSRDIQDIGQARFGKVFLALKYCFEAIWCRFRYGAKVFYYVPAAPLRSAVLRDCIVMALVRPFFKRRVYHWHAIGLTEWLETKARPWERKVARFLIGKPDLSIVLGRYNLADGEGVHSRNNIVVPNGVPDPCPDFDDAVLPRRQARVLARAARLDGQSEAGANSKVAGEDSGTFRLLFLSLCSREKGLFDAVEAVALARKKLPDLRLKLTVAGTFWVPEEEAEFQKRIQEGDLNDGDPMVDYRGFVSGDEKAALMRESDCLCFPTFYAAESFGLVLVEAMAHGMPVIATKWRTIPELVPEGMRGMVDPNSPEQIAEAIVELACERQYDRGLRDHFLARFTDAQFGANMTEAILSVEKGE